MNFTGVVHIIMLQKAYYGLQHLIHARPVAWFYGLGGAKYIFRRARYLFLLYA